VKVAKETKTLSAGGGWQGTYCGNILTAAKNNGFKGSYQKENMTIDSLKAITESGRPVIANVNTQGYWGSGHYMVVTGIKDGKVYVNDPWQGGQRTYSFASFKAQWATRNERAIVVQP
jgi:predicted double-glycine peptidase